MNCYNNSKINEILSSIKQINLSRGDFPKAISNPLQPVESLEKDLQGKNFADLSNKKQNTIYGDITIFNENAFRYYIFEIIEDSITRNELPPLFPMFLLGLSKKSMTFDNRLDLLSNNEKIIILDFLECLIEYITTSNNNDAIDLKEDYLEDIEEIVNFWRKVA